MNRILKIAVGRSKTARKWENQEVSWRQLVEHLRNFKVTRETVAEYQAMSKEEQSKVKDCGGFVGGYLINGQRKKGNVLVRSLVCLDMDFAPLDWFDRVDVALAGVEWLAYSTHSHTPEKPRVRLVVPLSRDVAQGEYEPLARKIAEAIGIDFFDDSTYQPERLMFWPSAPADGERELVHREGVFLDVQEWLSKYPLGWANQVDWPRSTREQEHLGDLDEDAARRRAQALQAQNARLGVVGGLVQDPLEKNGLVGAFCRAYPIREAIDVFLSHVYAPVEGSQDRYAYIPGEGSAGAIIYSGRWLFSHHATDPACNLLLNAFDLVKTHKFGAGSGADKQMREFASEDARVKIEFQREIEQRAVESVAAFENLGEDPAEDPAGESSGDSENTGAPVAWLAGLQYTKNGDIKETLSNYLAVLRNDSRLRGFAWNLQTSMLDKRERMPWDKPEHPLKGWTMLDDESCLAYMAETYGLEQKTKLVTALTKVAGERAFHPIRDYFDNLPAWDGEKRLEGVLAKYLGCADNAYHGQVFRKTLLAAVTRTYQPGAKFDQMLVLAGPQGIGKSTLFAKLAGKWFSDSLTISDMKSKDGPELLQGNLILEVSELAGMRKVDSDTIKKFITTTNDKYRPAYGRLVEEHPRECILVGTTNNVDGYLRDSTGNRRFWPVECTGESALHPWDLTDEVVEQLWAEAKAAYEAGESLLLPQELASETLERQTEALEVDETTGVIEEFLTKKVPADWETMSADEREAWLFRGGGGGSVARRTVSVIEVWVECFGKSKAELQGRRANSNGIIASLRKLGCVPAGRKRGAYGQQRVFTIPANIISRVAAST